MQITMKNTKRNPFNRDMDETLKRPKKNIQHQSRQSLLKVPVLILSLIRAFVVNYKISGG